MGRKKPHTIINRFGLFRISLCLVVAFAATVGPVFGESTESQVKAAFVYNFVKFVEWPAKSFQSADSSITLCTLGQDKLADTMESLNGRIAQGRKLAVKRISRPAEADRCNVIYIALSEREQAAPILRPTREGLLSIGDIKGFPGMGGIISFILAENRISFEINIDAAGRAGLKISSQILKLAKVYHENGRKDGGQ